MNTAYGAVYFCRDCSATPERRREETEHRSAVRKIPAFYTVATLCQLASEGGVGGQPSPVDVLRDTTLAPLQSFQAQERPEKKGKGKGRAYKQVNWCCVFSYFVNFAFLYFVLYLRVSSNSVIYHPSRSQQVLDK